MTFGYIAVGVGLAISGAASAYGASKQAGIANKELGLAADQQWKQDLSFEQLQQLISNPSSFFDSQIYKQSFSQGTQAVAKSNASQFGGRSGNESLALQGFGQSYGFGQLQQQEQLLAGMSGTGFNPVSGFTAASSAATNSMNDLKSLGGLISFFGSSGMAGGAPAAGGGEAPTNFDGSTTYSPDFSQPTQGYS